MTHGIQLEFRKTIKITQELIDNGIKSDSSACMVAEAIKIEFPSAEKVKGETKWQSVLFVKIA
jgi:hypothetical protein